MSFYLDSRAATLDTEKYRSFGRASQTQKLHYLLSISNVNISGIPWIGSGFIATEFRIELPFDFAFVRPYKANQNNTFGLAVRNPQTNLTGLNVTRYKIWDVENRVFYPLYNGQRLNKSFALELWTRPDSDEIIIDEPVELILSIRANPLDCCDLDNPLIEAAEFCGIWDFQDPEQSGEYDLPLMFSRCIVNAAMSSYFRVTELGDIRITELNDNRVWLK